MQRIDKKDVVLHDKYWIQNRVESGHRIIEYFESIPCGGFREINDNTEDYLEIPSSLLGNGEYFAVRAHGSSMIDAGIEDGDIVIVEKNDSPLNGQIAVIISKGKVSLKRFFKSEGKQEYILKPKNLDCENIVVDECNVLGIAVKVIKNIK